MVEISYVLPLKWNGDLDREELASYLRDLSGSVSELIVVDGSDPEEFQAGLDAWGSAAKVLRPDADLDFANGKVNGVTTGIRAASHDKVIIADDDVRHDTETLIALARCLEDADLVRPQNHFVGNLPWHAYIDGARSLLNRSVGHDFPGTFGVRRGSFLRMGGYDGNVMFENLELIRTVEANGGRVVSDRSLYVSRLPPTSHRYMTQRVRQAYDDFAQPLRMAVWLSLLPSFLAALIVRRRKWIAAAAAASITVAEFGRRRDGGAKYLPVGMSLSAPLWLIERSIAGWAAVGARVRGGALYGGKRIKRAARR